ncbi:putative collagen-binding domain-containing protein, partial [Planctomycetota bacterium]
AGGQGGQIRGEGDGAFPFSGFYSFHNVESDLESEQWLKYIYTFIEVYLGDIFGEMVPVASLADNSNKQYAISDPARIKILYWKTSSSDTYDPDSHEKMEVKLSGVSSSLIYDATWFDPRTGTLTSAGTLSGGSDYSLSPPSSQTDDWVLLLY